MARMRTHTHTPSHRAPFPLRSARVWQIKAPGSFNMSIVQHDLYSAYLVVCHRGGTFTGDVTTTFINLDPEGGLTQHLPIEATMLPALYSVSHWHACVRSDYFAGKDPGVFVHARFVGKTTPYGIIRAYQILFSFVQSTLRKKATGSRVWSSPAPPASK